MNRTSTPLRIAIIDFDDIHNPLLNAGQARATYEVGKRLVHDGYTVTVYTSRYPGYRDRTEEGIRYVHIGAGTQYIRANNLFFILSVPFTVRHIQADIIIESFTAPVSTLCSPLFTKIPVIGLPSMFNAKEFSRKYLIPFHWFEYFGAKCYKYFLPYSDIDSEKMKRLNPSIRYKIVPQGVDDGFFVLPHKPPKHILFLSRLDIDQKGIDLLLEAYAKVHHSIGFPLVIAGHGPDERRIRQRIEDMHLQHCVSLAGPAYSDKKNTLLSEAIYVAFPSRHDELSLWALEALASGMPLVAFDLPECKWMTEDVSLKARPFDTDEYASLLLKATDKRLNTKMRVQARALARKYTWEHVVDEFEEFIQTVLDNEKKD